MIFLLDTWIREVLICKLLTVKFKKLKTLKEQLGAPTSSVL